MTNRPENTDSNNLILVIAASGKTGRRVADKLEERGERVRRGSRTSELPFDWDRPDTWAPALEGVSAVYVVYTPDLSVPAAPEAIRQFTALAKDMGVGRLVLLSGRGEEEAQACERIVQESGVDSTIVRASWFNQNFSEGPFFDSILSGELALPVGETKEPFIDVDDIADVVVAALTEDGHQGQLYEVTGPRLMSFREAVGEIAAASGTALRFTDIPLKDFVEGLGKAGVPSDYIDLLAYLFETLLDGRNESTADGVQRALGREPADFSDYVKRVAASGVWNAAAKAN